MWFIFLLRIKKEEKYTSHGQGYICSARAGNRSTIPNNWKAHLILCPFNRGIILHLLIRISAVTLLVYSSPVDASSEI